ncbi:phosphotransferase [Corynebacterium sp. HMSC29G08]|uniref:phosphotransferase n=1 Tax=Corynebacterium sp. HMSC29G08 TaxID=1581069 RepID=UPI0008A654B5|nr:phosphotransferase [Corynebacterium sp. HMSC29G08]OFT85800.1 phosphotransferase [Corynebacterium sp. HMSC29G08]
MDRNTVISTAESVLTRRYGGAQKLTDVTELSGSGVAGVYRAKVTANPFLQHRTVVVKHSPETGNLLDDAAFLREVVAYQFTTSLSSEVRPGPVLLGYDVDARMIILSDVGDADTLATMLERADDIQHVQILRNLGTALGKMHAGTADKETQFNALFARMTRSRIGAEKVQQLRDRLLSHRIRLGLAILEQAGFEIPNEVKVTASNLQTRLLRGGVRAFTPFDLSPDNVMYTDSGTQFLDYEWAGFRDAIFDVAFVVAGFPLYISPRTYHEDAISAFIEAWLREVRATWPLLNHEDTLQARITAGMIGWALSSLTMLNPVALAEVVASDEDLAAEFAAAGVDVNEEITESALGFADAGIPSGDMLRPASDGPFTHEELIVREDLRETFNALSAYAGTGRDTAYLVISQFARDVALRLK